MGELGHDGVLGGAGATGAPLVAFGHTVRDGRAVPEVGLTAQGNGGAGDPFTTFGRQVSKIMTNRVVTSWGNPKTRLWQIICGGRPPSMQKAVVQGYVGEKVDTRREYTPCSKA